MMQSSMLTLNIIGPGRLGKSLARLAQASGQYQIGGVYSRSFCGPAVDFIGAGRVCSALEQLPEADLFLLAVPDAAIAGVAAELAASGVVRPGNIVFHASGVSESTLLQPLAASGAYLASLHPAFSFADPALAVKTFTGTLCALALGGKPFALRDGGKAAYHASLTMAANYLVTLADLSVRTAREAGISDEIAQSLVLNLMQQTLSNIKALGPAAALTGPVVRGDLSTVETHLAALTGTTRRCYQSMGLATIELAGERLSAEQQLALQQLCN